jgi:hypothetical protein
MTERRLFQVKKVEKVPLRMEMLGKGKPAKERLTFQPSALPSRQEQIINPSSRFKRKVQDILTYDQASRVLGVVLPIRPVAHGSVSVCQPCATPRVKECQGGDWLEIGNSHSGKLLEQ